MQIQGKISRGDDKRGRVLLMFLLHVDKNNAKKGTKRGSLIGLTKWNLLC